MLPLEEFNVFGRPLSECVDKNKQLPILLEELSEGLLKAATQLSQLGTYRCNVSIGADWWDRAATGVVQVLRSTRCGDQSRETRH